MMAVMMRNLGMIVKLMMVMMMMMMMIKSLVKMVILILMVVMILIVLMANAKIFAVKVHHGSNDHGK